MTRKTFFLTALVVASCVEYEDPDLNQTEQLSTVALGANLYVGVQTLQADGLGGTCTAGGVQQTCPLTRREVYMEEGDTLWVGGTVYATYQPAAGAPAEMSAVVRTRLACAPTDSIADFDDPQDAWFQSSTITNHYRGKAGFADKLTATHLTKAVYTPAPGTEGMMHTCWLLYGMGGDPGYDQTRFSAASFLTYHSVNQYPGENFRLNGSGSQIIATTGTHTPGGPQYWEAGTSTQGDTEVVVYWSPLLTTCQSPDATCAAVGMYDGDDANGYYDTRLVVYQQTPTATCNIDGGTWTSRVLLKPDHHYDVETYSRVVPIVTGTGNQQISCGSDRTFKVWAQIRKTYDTAPYPDILIEGDDSAAPTNLLIYSR